MDIDVPGIMRLWRHVAPYLATQSPIEALISLHVARCEALSVPLRLRLYSYAWLKERGYQKDDRGSWFYNEPPPEGIPVQAVGIGSRSSIPGRSKEIVHVMREALYEARDKGVEDPLEQRYAMLNARKKYKFRRSY